MNSATACSGVTGSRFTIYLVLTSEKMASMWYALVRIEGGVGEIDPLFSSHLGQTIAEAVIKNSTSHPSPDYHWQSPWGTFLYSLVHCIFDGRH